MENSLEARVEALRLSVHGGHSSARAIQVAEEYEKYLRGELVIDIPAPQVAPVTVKASIRPDFLICLEDGMKFKSLKRHLATLGLTPEQYRAKWKLPANYPMVAPNYSAHRSKLAIKMKLGKSR